MVVHRGHLSVQCKHSIQVGTNNFVRLGSFYTQKLYLYFFNYTVYDEFFCKKFSTATNSLVLTQFYDDVYRWLGYLLVVLYLVTTWCDGVTLS